jgi:serine/threonine protein kinase
MTFEKDSVDDAHDEQLGGQLDAYFRQLLEQQSSSLGNHPVGETAQLYPLVDQLYELSRYLARDSVGPVPAASAGQESATATVTVGKYRVLSCLGRGGQSTTVLAVDPDLQRQVVLKLYHSLHDPEKQLSVLNEGRALVRVRSPYVVQCYGVERHDEMPYLVLEHIEGESLQNRRREQPFSVRESLEVTKHLAEGLAKVHQAGLLHRDLKPANVLLDRAGRPHLIDFGLSATSDATSRADRVGTPAYMAPEQARGDGDRGGVATDIWGLGAVLYELLTNRAPFEASSRDESLRLAQHGEVKPPSQWDPRLPRYIDRLVLRCLAPQRDQRFPSASAVGIEIDQILRRRTRTSRLAWTAFAFTLFSLTAGTIVWFKTERSQVVDRREISRLPTSEDKHAPITRVIELRKDFDVAVSLSSSRRDAQGRILFEEDETLSLIIRPSRDCYLEVWSYEDDDTQVLLFPNGRQPSNAISAGQTVTVPDEQQLIRAERSQRGEELRLIAATHGFTNVTGENVSGYIQLRSRDELASFERRYRGLQLVPKPASPGEPAVTILSIPYFVQSRSTKRDPAVVTK